MQKFLMGYENNSASISISRSNILGMLIGGTSRASFLHGFFNVTACTRNLLAGSHIVQDSSSSFDQGFPCVLNSLSPHHAEVSLHTSFLPFLDTFSAANSQLPVREHMNFTDGK